MDRRFYCEEIIKNMLVPFINEVFPDGHRFMQVTSSFYARQHTSIANHSSIKAREVLQDLKVNWWKTPPE